MKKTLISLIPDSTDTRLALNLHDEIIKKAPLKTVLYLLFKI